MGTEIERRFKLREFPDPEVIPDPCVARRSLEQFYLATSEKGVVRIRVGESQRRPVLAVKGPGLLAREEHECEISASGEMLALLKRLSCGRVEKERFLFITSETDEYVIDVFQGVHEGLVIMEVEFSSKKEAVEYKLPEWVKNLCEAEVTEDPAYANSSLAMQ
jgi:adenylate cyclase